MNLYARLFQGDTAWNNAVSFLQKFLQPNLFNSDNGPGTAMQIDGNFGFVSGIAEMLLQSHTGVVHILPALPSAVPTGSVTGLVARGSFVVDIQWANKVLVNSKVTSRVGGQLALRVATGAGLAVNGIKYSGPISTTAGGIYNITLML